MPQLQSIVLTDNTTATQTYEPVSNIAGLALFRNMAGGQVDIAPYFSVQNKRVNSYEQGLASFVIPRTKTDADTGLTTKIGECRHDLKMKFSVDATEVERAYEYDLFVEMLQDPTVREMFIKRSVMY